jgi:hypothetical protein
MKKKLSKFICKELLYDYSSGVLDNGRHTQVEAYLQEDAELKKELDSLELALKYTSQLKKVTLSQPYHQELRDVYQKEGKTYFIKKVGLRVAQGSGVFVALALLYLYFPAEQIVDYFKRDPNKIIIAEIETTGKKPEINPAEIAAEEEPESLLSPDDETAAAAPEATEGEEQEVRLSPEQEKKLREELERQEAEQKLAAQAETQKPAEPVMSPEPKKPAEQKVAGFVYRAFITSEKRDEIADAIVQRIGSLGGQKAGSVEIGWPKPNGNRYFHFSMTEANFEILKTYLGTLAPVEIAKSPHPRVMPSGQVRMILEVQSP